MIIHSFTITIHLCAYPSFHLLTCLHTVHLLIHMVSLSIYFTFINQLINLLILPSIYHPFTNPPFALPIYPPAFLVIPLPLQPSNNLSYTHPSVCSSINPSIICPCNDLPMSSLIHLSVIHSSISPSTHPPVLVHSPPYTYPSIHQLIQPSDSPSMYLVYSFVHLPFHLPNNPSILSIYVAIHLLPHLPISMPKTLSHQEGSSKTIVTLPLAYWASGILLSCPCSLTP